MNPPIVAVVDDDPAVRKALGRLLRSVGYAVELFATATDFLARPNPGPDSPACLIVDLRMPEVSGLELLEALEQRGLSLSVIFISGHVDIRATVKAMKLGAIDFLTKPFGDEQLLANVAAGVSATADWLQAHGEQVQLRERFQGLTPREREVCLLVARGLLNKQVAYELGVVEKTVKVHRARVMEKLAVGSVAELVRLVDRMATRTSRKGAAESAKNDGLNH